VKPADRSLHGLKQLIIKNLYQFNVGVSICDIHALNNIISFIYNYEEVCLDNLPVVYVTYVEKTIRSNAGRGAIS
jgi:hypothetical protein